MKRLNWDIIKKFYKEEFGFEGWMVELFANQEVLLLCASGANNNTISSFTEIPVDEVVEIIRLSFKFDGWNPEIPINPYGYYSQEMKEKDTVLMSEFIEELRNQCHLELDYKLIYSVCKTMWEIEDKINNEWT
jgi:hypothetical protein